MGGLTSTTGSSLLKNWYLPPIQYQLNSETILLKYPKKDYESVSGGNIVIPVHLTRNSGIGAIAEGGTLPTAGNQGYTVTSFAPKYHYGSIAVTDQMIERTKGDKAAFAKALESEIKGMTRDMSKYLNILLFGNGTGKLAEMALTTNSTTVNVVTNRNLMTGYVVDILVETDKTTTSTASATITALSGTTAFTIGAACTADTTYIVTMSGSYDNVLMGLEGIVSASDPPTGDFEGIDRGTYSAWCSNASSNSGTARTLTLQLMETAVNTIARWGGKCNVILTNYGPRYYYMSLVNTNKRYVNTMQLDGGFTGIEFDGIPVVVDTDCPYNSTTNGKMYFLDMSHLTHYRLADFKWLEDDKGATLIRSSTSATWNATLAYYGQFGTAKPRAHYLLDDIITSTEIE